MADFTLNNSNNL